MQVVVRDCFQAAGGQLEFIGNGSVLVSHAAAILLTENYAGPHDSLVSQPTVFLMGQCELIV